MNRKPKGHNFRMTYGNQDRTLVIPEARKKQHLTQEELAMRIGTAKNYISRIENDASDIRLTTLMRIIRVGLGGQLILNFSI